MAATAATGIDVRPWSVERTPALPVGTCLLHIGPPKTGTTSVQAAFWASRHATRAQGVRYAGTSRHSASAILAVTGRRLPGDDHQPPIEHWGVLRDEVRAAARQGRVLLSSESFAYAAPEAVERIVDDLRPAAVHVVVTLRPLVRMVPSVWQEQVQSGATLGLDEWLASQLAPDEGDDATYLWRLHRHDRLVERWASVVGPDQVTVLVADDADHGAVLREFEAMSGLRPMTLLPVRDLANRALTLPEIEAVRALRLRFLAAGVPKHEFHRIVRNGAAAYLKTRRPPPDEPRIELPRWAIERTGEVARRVVDGIAASGVRVIGDLDRLAAVPEGGREGAPPEAAASPEIAAWLAMGMMQAATPRRDEERRRGRKLAAALIHRVRRSATRPVRAVRRRADPA